MFFIFSKLLYFLILPFTWIVICFTIAVFTKKVFLKKKLILAGFILLLFFSNELVINEILSLWEIPPTPLKEVPEYDIGIVLTGVTNLEKEPFDRVYFNKGADRVTHAIQLYRIKKIKKILISGGSGLLINNKNQREATKLQPVFEMCGVNPDDIIIESNSRNTHENAKFSAKILNEKYSTQKYLLITSAFHMRRAKACFSKTGLKFETFSTDFYTFEPAMDIFMILPSVGAIDKWGIFIKEIVGITMYKVSGFI